jgi:hypothetical protein
MKRSHGLGCWGAHGHVSGVKPPAQNHHDAKAGTHMRGARRVRGTRHGGASRGDPQHELGAQRFGPRVLGCTTASSWVDLRGSWRQTRHECRTWLARGRVLGSKHDAMVDPNSAGVRFTRHGQQGSTRGERTTSLTVGRRCGRRRLGVEDTQR